MYNREYNKGEEMLPRSEHYVNKTQPNFFSRRKKEHRFKVNGMSKGEGIGNLVPLKTG